MLRFYKKARKIAGFRVKLSFAFREKPHYNRARIVTVHAGGLEHVNNVGARMEQELQSFMIYLHDVKRRRQIRKFHIREICASWNSIWSSRG